MKSFNCFDGNAGHESICPEVNAFTSKFARHEEAIKNKTFTSTSTRATIQSFGDVREFKFLFEASLCVKSGIKKPQVFDVTNHNTSATGNLNSIWMRYHAGKK